MESNKTHKIYESICNVTGELSKIGVGKDKKNPQQGYNFRGVDDVMNALSSLLAKNHICILPRMVSKDVQERQNRNGGVLIYTTVDAEFDFVSALDGSFHTVKTYGEAMDSGDKSTNKAMSAAYKYACLQAFCIPTEGDNDSENQTHELAAANTTTQPKPKTQTANAKPPATAKANTAPVPAASAHPAGTEEAQKLKEALLAAGFSADKLKEYWAAAFGDKAAQAKATPADYVPTMEWLLAIAGNPGTVDEFNADPASFGKQWNLNHAKAAVN
jgi:hypothetical protein